MNGRALAKLAEEGTEGAEYIAERGYPGAGLMRRLARAVSTCAAYHAPEPDAQLCATPGCRNPLPPYCGNGRPRKFCLVCSPPRR